MADTHGRLAGKVAIITGGARGQGAAEARLFASEGAKVVLTDVLEEDAAIVSKELGVDAISLRHDVTSAEDWQRVVEAAIETFGGLDVLVNNAGIFRVTPIAVTSAEDYMQIVTVNQLGTFLGMQAVAGPMTDGGGGSIVNISSIAGLRGAAGTSAYTASKFAVRGMTKVAAIELAAAGIRVNSVHPGIIHTPMLHDLFITTDEERAAMASRIPVGSVAAAEEVASVVLFLASDDSSHCTGGEFVVDGGITAGMGFQ